VGRQAEGKDDRHLAGDLPDNPGNQARGADDGAGHGGPGRSAAGDVARAVNRGVPSTRAGPPGSTRRLALTSLRTAGFTPAVCGLKCNN